MDEIEVTYRAPEQPAETEEQRAGLVKVSYELLAQALRLPANARIVATTDYGLYGFNQNALTLKIVCPDLRAVGEAHQIPEYRPVYDKEGFVKWA